MALKIHPQPTIDTITDICNHIQISQSSRHDKVPAVVNRLLNSWSTKECYDHISPVSIPSHDRIIEIVQQARRILFPGYFTRTGCMPPISNTTSARRPPTSTRR